MKQAFTLAEVLITIGIIGVVAALTLPTVINDTRNKQLEVGFKVGYSRISEAVARLAKDKNVDYITTSMFPRRTLKNELMKYFQSTEDCGMGTEAGACLENLGSTGNMAGYRGVVYRTFSNKANMNVCRLDDGQFILNNGFTIFIDNEYGWVMISIDTNGIDRGPNRWGYDLFTFDVTPEGLKPMGAPGTFPTKAAGYSGNMDDYCSKTSTNINNGLTCTNKAVTDRNYFRNLP